MRILKTKFFNKWAEKECLTDTALVSAINEMERGLVDAFLGGNVVKKRIGIRG